MTFIGGQFHKRYLSHQWPKLAGKLLIWKFLWKLPGTNELTVTFIWWRGCINWELLTHWGLNKIMDILHLPFSGDNSFVFWFKFNWSLFRKVQLSISHHWFRWWLDAQQETNHYLNQCGPVCLRAYDVSRSQYVNIYLLSSNFAWLYVRHAFFHK